LRPTTGRCWASAGQISALFLWFGAFGLLGNVLLTRWVDRLGAARCVNLALALMALVAAAPGRWPPACRPWRW
jgi:DHA1 family inner membrane transport protein